MDFTSEYCDRALVLYPEEPLPYQHQHQQQHEVVQPEVYYACADHPPPPEYPAAGSGRVAWAERSTAHDVPVAGPVPLQWPTVDLWDDDDATLYPTYAFIDDHELVGRRKRQTTPTQRVAANIRERRRMGNLNTAFDRLRRRVPAFAHEKRLSRIQTLRLAITYIAFMSQLLARAPGVTSAAVTSAAVTSATVTSAESELLQHVAWQPYGYDVSGAGHDIIQ